MSRFQIIWCVCAHVGEKETENTNKDIIDTHNKNTEE